MIVYFFRLPFALKLLFCLAFVRLFLTASTLNAYLSNQKLFPALWQPSVSVTLRQRTVTTTFESENVIAPQHSINTMLPLADNLLVDDTATTPQAPRSILKEAAMPSMRQIHRTKVGGNASEGSSVMILVLSARGHFTRRAAIRETWAASRRNIVFMIGGKGCNIPPEYRHALACSWNHKGAKANQSRASHFEEGVALEQLKLEAEAKKFNDTVLLPLEDTYRTLPRKLKLGYRWTLEHSEAAWIVKVDDDFYVHMDRLEDYLMKHEASRKVIGRIGRGIGVDRRGKWAEHDYVGNRYPPFPFGSCGHVVSRDVAAAILQADPHEYQGEDTSLGIWVHNLSNVSMISTLTFTNRGNCRSSQKIVVGHGLSPEKLRWCHQHVVTRNRLEA